MASEVFMEGVWELLFGTDAAPGEQSRKLLSTPMFC